MSTVVFLGGIPLSDSVIITDRISSQSVAQSVERTLGGALKVFHATLYAGAQITIEATEEAGWVSKTIIDQLSAIANQAGAVFQLLVNGESRSVIFRHDEPPAFVAKPLVYRTNLQSGDYFTFTIKLLTV